jgi:hypothetical protein
MQHFGAERGLALLDGISNGKLREVDQAVREVERATPIALQDLLREPTAA